MTLQKFYKELEKHDWYYEMSDDNSVWRTGKESYYRLQDLAQESPSHCKLFLDYKEYMFSGEPWGTIKKDKPSI